MSKYPYNSRRSFLKKFAALSALTASSLPANVVEQQQKALLKRTVRTLSPNDRLQIATIGMGIIGFIDTVTAISVPGIELVAACDLYDGRLVHTKEVFGDQVTTTRDYKEIIDRSDVDAILIYTPNYWHARIDRFSVGGQIKFANEALGTARLDADGGPEVLDSCIKWIGEIL